MVINP
ncbi:hypothetical protein VCHC47A1_1123, partial [Vibrio cholerae HC-47A1]